MKFHDFEDFLSKGNADSTSEIQRLRKVQAEIRRIKRRRVLTTFAALTALFTTASAAYLLVTNGNNKAQPELRRGSDSP